MKHLFALRVSPTREERRALEAENKRWPANLVRVPEEALDRRSIIPRDHQPDEVWRSRDFLVQVFNEKAGVVRLSVIRTCHDGNQWADGITWDELQRLKMECGRGDKEAVEVFPRDRDVVNVSNIRHLWVLPEPLPFVWRNKGSTR
ncbi:MAG: hypothetical protein A3E01_10030 [Gammaproteobacteria bacterium RIFCSPHIGHO2_12_FULL_63_22]|nr:MAG: hypothetical protein A3E01_10030 [Gammaproteobacteria bacterium RIFCSPHIGHO2_12_FULL_63_22]